MANQEPVALEVCEEPLSKTTWIECDSSMLASISSKRSMKLTESLRAMSRAATLPVETSIDAVPLWTYSNSCRGANLVGLLSAGAGAL